MERESLLRLYDSTCKSTHIPLSSSARAEDFPMPDLRRTINCLQLRCSTIGAIPPSGCTVQWHTEPEYSVECLSDWSQTQQPFPTVSSANAEFPLPRGLVIDHADLVSFVDSELVQSDFEVSEVRVHSWHRSVVLTVWARHLMGLSPLLMMKSVAPYRCILSRRWSIYLNFDITILPRQLCDFHVMF